MPCSLPEQQPAWRSLSKGRPVSAPLGLGMAWARFPCRRTQLSRRFEGGRPWSPLPRHRRRPPRHRRGPPQPVPLQP